MRTAAKALAGACILLLTFLAGVHYRAGNAGTPAGGRRILFYQDPMHPAYKSDKPGIAPDCAMQLEPVYADGGGPAASAAPGLAHDTGTLAFSLEKRQLLGVRIGQAKRSDGAHSLRLLGRVTVDESRAYRIYTGVDGWVREISPAVAGSIVRKDELLASIFSREVVSAAQSLIYTVSARERALQAGEKENQMTAAESQIRNATESLEAMGMSRYQVQHLLAGRQPSPIMEVRAPADALILERNISKGQRADRNRELYRVADLTHVWVLADLYESDGAAPAPGTHVQVHYHGRTLPATVANALPQFEPATRTLKVRLEMDNPGYLLRPDMFVDVELPVKLPPAVTVPADAVIDSGSRKVVYVDLGNGFLEAREVETGWRAGNVVAISQGLEAGERVVVSGNFLLDSESRMKSAAMPGPEAAGTVRDPSCGMQIDPAKAAAKREYKGRTHYFCSPACKEKFDHEHISRVGNQGVASLRTNLQ